MKKQSDKTDYMLDSLKTTALRSGYSLHDNAALELVLECDRKTGRHKETILVMNQGRYIKAGTVTELTYAQKSGTKENFPEYRTLNFSEFAKRGFPIQFEMWIKDKTVVGLPKKRLNIK